MTPDPNPRSNIDQRIDRMVELAGAGRGLWIGLVAKRDPMHELVKVGIDAANPSVVSERAKGAHVTIAHMGKKNGRREVEGAITVCHISSETLMVSSVGIECLARFVNHVVAIVEPRWIDLVCDRIDAALEDRHLFRDRSFAGIRHVTMVQLRRDAEFVKIAKIKKYALSFDKLCVFCGDEKFEFALPEHEVIF